MIDRGLLHAIHVRGTACAVHTEHSSQSVSNKSVSNKSSIHSSIHPSIHPSVHPSIQSASQPSKSSTVRHMHRPILTHGSRGLVGTTCTSREESPVWFVGNGISRPARPRIGMANLTCGRGDLEEEGLKGI